MLAASYLFYGYWDWRFLFLLAGVTLVNEVLGVALFRNTDERTGKALLGLALVLNLGLLGVFKYFQFFAESFADAFGFSPPMFNVLLPVGISFYTFQAISYVVDIHRGTATPVALLDFAVYLSFFPQLVAGPIVRATEFMPQLRQRTPPTQVEATRAAVLIARGAFKKVVISSYLARTIVDDVFAQPEDHGGLEILVATYGYALQIYADFSGYTDMAIGIALLLGFRFPLNFDRPYTAVSIQDFWRRWHMTLSRWLRDYVYFPLGGNRQGKLLTYRNLFIVMAVGGLWHGAAMTFVVWGVLHGLGLGAERFLSELRGETDLPVGEADVRIQEVAALHSGTKLEPWRPDPTSPVPFTPLQVRQLWLGRIVTFHFVCLAWVFFRAASVGDATTMLGRIVTAWSFDAPLVTPGLIVVIVVVLASQYVPPLAGSIASAMVSRVQPLVQAVAVGLVLALIVSLGPEGVSPFIYFQF